MASNAQGGNATANSTADLTASVSGESNSAGYLTAGAHAGSDIIVGGNDNDIMSGDALAAGEGSIALANNTADGDVTEGQYGGGWFTAGAGNDMLGDGAEGDRKSTRLNSSH